MRKLRPFWRDGRITQWPARESRRRLVLAEVVRAFPPGKRLAEAEVDAILLGFLGVGVPGEQRLFGVGPELVTASLDREGRPPEELRVLVGLADDDLDGAALTGRDRTGIAVAAFQELDQPAPQRVIEMT